MQTVCDQAYTNRFTEMLEIQPVCVCSHLNCHIVWTAHGAIVSCFRQGNIIKYLWGNLNGTWELALVMARILVEKWNLCYLFMNLECPIRFRGVFQTLQANVPLPFTFITDPTLPQFATWTFIPLVSSHPVSPAPQCSKLTVMTVSTFFPSSHYISACSSSFSKLR